MTVSTLFSLILFAFATLLPLSAMARVELGIDVLESDGYALLEGKRVGLITNQTGINSRGILTRKVLHDAKNVQLVALFAPEHGLDGTTPAGKQIHNAKDPLTGLTVHSIYGRLWRPTREMLTGLDALVFDIQDIGSRSYTYIATMVKSMDAAGKRDVEFIILDRPNPLGGLRVEGPSLEPRWMSIVGQLRVPYCHGMTMGELAQMTNAKGWVEHPPRLTVVRMRGWQRNMTWDQTGLQWIATSPNVPHSTTPFYYAATGLAGSMPGVDIGAGGLHPFQHVATEHLRASTLATRMSALGLPGVTFTPYIKGDLQGVNVEIKPHYATPLCAINVHLLNAAHKATPGGLFTLRRVHYDVFYKCYGSDSIRLSLEGGAPPQQIIAAWSLHNVRFMADREPFLLY